MSLGVSPTALVDLPAAALPMQPHQMENLFWERLLPVLVVVAAAVAAAAASRLIALRKDEAALSPTQGLRHFLRAVIQIFVYLGVVAGALFMDHALHGDPKGLDMTLRFGSTVAFLWAGFLAMDIVERHLHARFLSQGRSSANAVIPLLDKVAKGAWSVLVTIMFLENMGMTSRPCWRAWGWEAWPWPWPARRPWKTSSAAWSWSWTSPYVSGIPAVSGTRRARWWRWACVPYACARPTAP
ncbi:MAG TPA: hypothetical protein VK786_04850 [bacterium]|nr:hypothetical protein [bacterium]